MYAVAIIRTTNGYYSFDSRSWDKDMSNGMSNGMSNANGRAVVMEPGKQLQESCKFSSETLTITRFAPTSTQ